VGRAYNSGASQGNALEAIHLCLDMFERVRPVCSVLSLSCSALRSDAAPQHHIDRDLWHTGQEVIMVTAGTGVMDIDHHLEKASPSACPRVAEALTPRS
jgi:hypothetical protein